jgi:hypothetical protein
VGVSPSFLLKIASLTLFRTAGAIILRIAYGYEAAEEDDPFVRLADEAVEQFSLSTTPGFLVNFFPPCKEGYLD